MSDKFLKRFSTLFIELHGNKDIFTFLVRGHLYCESTLSNILLKAIKRPNALDIDRLDYQARVNLCNAFALIPKGFVPGLTKLGTLRNKYVHRLEYKATKKDQSDLINAIKPTGGLPSQYYLSKRIEFPNGFRRAILSLWLPLEIQLAKNKKEAKDMLVSVAVLMGRMSGLEPDEFIEVMKKELSSFYKKL